MTIRSSQDAIVAFIAATERDADESAIYCCGYDLALNIVARLAAAGYSIVPADPAEYGNVTEETNG